MCSPEEKRAKYQRFRVRPCTVWVVISEPFLVLLFGLVGSTQCCFARDGGLHGRSISILFSQARGRRCIEGFKRSSRNRRIRGLFSSFGLAGDTVNAIKTVVAKRLSSADDVTVKGESLGPRYRSRPTPGPWTPVHALHSVKKKKAQRGSATNFNRNPKTFKFATPHREPSSQRLLMIRPPSNAFPTRGIKCSCLSRGRNNLPLTVGWKCMRPAFSLSLFVFSSFLSRSHHWRLSSIPVSCRTRSTAFSSPGDLE